MGQGLFQKDGSVAVERGGYSYSLAGQEGNTAEVLQRRYETSGVR